MQNRYSVIIGVCFWLVLIFFGLRYFLSDWSGQGRKETATNKPSAAAVSAQVSKERASDKPSATAVSAQVVKESAAEKLSAAAVSAQVSKERASDKPSGAAVSAQVIKGRAAEKPSAAVVSKASRLSKFPALRKYVESLRQIPAGTFQMGSSSGDSDEKPVHSVTLSAFRMGATPVTVAVWKEYCAATGTLPEAPSWGLLDDHPVVNVSWNDIMGVDGKGGFCAWASDIAGFRLTLPTEAQFEYASRGGQSGEYPWGNTFDDSKLWCSESSKRTSTAPVTRSSNIFRNAYGLTDMSGNVWQWCSDWYGPYGSASQTDPQGPRSSSENSRCVRGGSWSNFLPVSFRCALRFGFFPDIRVNGVGFRLSAGPS